LGVPSQWLRQLVDDWLEFDVAGFETRLNRLAHYGVDIGGLRIHCVIEHGRGPDPLPLLLTHGWPGSFCEYLNLIPLLTDPGAHGADPGDSFTVIAPSLPGFGFSGQPSRPMTSSAVAELWHQLLTEQLAMPQYVAHGSDLGAGVTIRLARSHPDSVRATHLATPGLPEPPEPRTDAENTYIQETAAWTAAEGGYAHEHATKPATLGIALNDSPAGLAAWIGEKIHAWSSAGQGGEPAFDRELLLGTLTVYWVTESITSSLLPYWAYRNDAASAPTSEGRSPVPAAVSIFAGEHVPFPKPPRELAERYLAVSDWHEYDRGGHFPAVAEPRLLAAIMRDVFRPAR
jgi:pimeloyl-ACP methyl ester carboxylesterase